MQMIKLEYVDHALQVILAIPLIIHVFSLARKLHILLMVIQQQISVLLNALLHILVIITQ
jgi:hypothetical protein